eukprot:TRINITY_DN13150_c0_g1_i1.p1 TRINITY_DN13150_c0_g1~~TRINITY_DN13150_c0_g1_i1.p1  ORF type:complete len:244 (+),score=49.56 TRINITY_DN13150_c0_g1_i1:26-733(+)
MATLNPFRFIHLLFGSGRFLSLLVVAYLFVFLGISDVISTALQYTEYRYQWTPLQYGVQSSIAMAVGVLVQSLGLKLILRCFGDRIVIVVSLFMQAGFHILMGLSFEPWMFFASSVGSQFAIVNFPAIQSLISNGIPEDQQAAGLGALSSVSNISLLIGSLLMGNSFAYFISKEAIIRIIGIPFYLGAFFFVIASAILWINFGVKTKDKIDNRKSTMTFETMDETTPLSVSLSIN